MFYDSGNDAKLYSGLLWEYPSFKSYLCAGCNDAPSFREMTHVSPSSRTCARVATSIVCPRLGCGIPQVVPVRGLQLRLHELNYNPVMPSSRTCARVATANSHKITDSCTDYYVHILTFSSVSPALNIKVLRLLSRFWDGKSPRKSANLFAFFCSLGVRA